MELEVRKNLVQLLVAGYFFFLSAVVFHILAEMLRIAAPLYSRWLVESCIKHPLNIRQIKWLLFKLSVIFMLTYSIPPSSLTRASSRNYLFVQHFALKLLLNSSSKHPQINSFNLPNCPIIPFPCGDVLAGHFKRQAKPLSVLQEDYKQTSSWQFRETFMKHHHLII